MPLGAESFSATVSGFSAGGYFSSTTQVANSDVFQGVGIFAGAPYGAKVLADYDNDVQKNIETAQKKESNRVIPSLGNLKDKPVYIHHGRADTIITIERRFQAAEFFNYFGANVKLDITDYNHVVPTIHEKCNPADS